MTDIPEHIVILGAGHGGVQAAASLREEGFGGTVTLVSEEADAPYHKPPLSKTFIKDAAAEPQPLRGEVFYTGHDITLDLGRRAVGLDAKARRLTMSDGRNLAFDRLILATGARPRALPLPGAELIGVVALRTLADARLIRDLAAHAEEVVVIGAGFIGLEIAATLAAGGRRITVLEVAERPLGRAVAEVISSHVRARLEAGGIPVRTGVRIERIVGENGHAAGVELAGGERIPARLVIVGIGVVPNVELATEAGLETHNGIGVDASMRTTSPDILAIGDCCNYRHWMTGTDLRLESVQNATDQAKLAARTLLGHHGSYDAVPWFWSDIGDMKLQMVGLVGRQDRHVVVGAPDENRFSVFHFAGERLIAVESVNRPADHILGRRILATDFSPDPDALRANPDGLKAAFAAWQAAQPGN